MGPRKYISRNIQDGISGKEDKTTEYKITVSSFFLHKPESIKFATVD
jgi:hypothetical protein